MNVVFSFHLPLKTSNSIFFSSNFPCLKLTINCFFSIFSSSKYTSKGKNVASAISPLRTLWYVSHRRFDGVDILTTVSRLDFPKSPSKIFLTNASSHHYCSLTLTRRRNIRKLLHFERASDRAKRRGRCELEHHVVALTFSMFSPAPPPKNNTIGVDTAPMENSCMSLNRTTTRNSFTCGPL